MEYKIRIECFRAYGLNAHRNFLSEATIDYGSEELLYEELCALLMDYNCEDCAIFVHCYDERMLVARKYYSLNEEDYVVEVAEVENGDTDFFARYDGVEHLCCYGLMIEVEPLVYKIIVN